MAALLDRCIPYVPEDLYEDIRYELDIVEMLWQKGVHCDKTRKKLKETAP